MRLLFHLKIVRVTLHVSAAMAPAVPTIFCLAQGCSPWTSQFQMTRLQKLFPEDDAANLIFYNGFNHSTYAVTTGKCDESVSFGSAYYVNDSEYIEHPLFTPLKEGQRFRPTRRCDYSEGNSSLDDKSQETYNLLSKSLTLVRQEHETMNAGYCQSEYGEGDTVRSHMDVLERPFSPSSTIMVTSASDQLTLRMTGNGLPKVWNGSKDPHDPQRHAYQFLRHREGFFTGVAGATDGISAAMGIHHGLRRKSLR